jgi:hypothetical protein
MAAENGMTDLELRATSNLAIRRSETNWLAALDAYATAMELARRTGRREAMLSTAGNFGYGAFIAGEWERGLEVLTPLMDEEVSVRDRVGLLNNFIIIRAHRGEDCTDALAELAEHSASLSAFDAIASVADAAANMALAVGDLGKARDEFLKIAAEASLQPEYGYRAALATLWMRDVEGARDELGKLEANAGSGPTASARKAAIGAGVAALEGRTADAMALYRAALQGLRDTRAVWDEALIGLTMAETLDPSDAEVAAILATTRAILERLRAKPHLARLDAATARSSKAATAATPSKPTENVGVATVNS